MDIFEKSEQEKKQPLRSSSKRKYLLVGVIATIVIVSAGILAVLTQKQNNILDVLEFRKIDTTATVINYDIVPGGAGDRIVKIETKGGERINIYIPKYGTTCNVNLDNYLQMRRGDQIKIVADVSIVNRIYPCDSTGGHYTEILTPTVADGGNYLTSSFDFKIRYPDGWAVLRTPRGDSSDDIVFAPLGTSRQVGKYYNGLAIGLTAQSDISKDFSIRDYVYSRTTAQEDVLSIEDLDVYGYAGVKVRYIFFPDNTGEFEEFDRYFVIKNDKFLILEQLGRPSQEGQALLSEMMSTLTYVGRQLVTDANMHSYENTEFGFELTVPIQWIIEEQEAPENIIRIEGPDMSILIIAPLGLEVGDVNDYDVQVINGEMLDGKLISQTNFITNSGDVWKQTFRFNEAPPRWSADAIIIVQYDFIDLEILCAVPITKEHPECREGDGLKYHGRINQSEQAIIEDILSTFRFIESETKRQIQTLEIIPSQKSDVIIYYQEGAKAIATGMNLSKVEFRQHGGGQIYLSSEGGLIGVGTMTSVKNGEEKWEVSLPSERAILTLCAVGFDFQGNKAGEVCLYNVIPESYRDLP